MMAPYSEVALLDRLKHWANEPEKDAFVFVSPEGPRIVISNQQIYDLSREFATNLLRIGVTQGSFICTLLPNSPEAMVALFGIQLAGCVVQSGHIQLEDGKMLIQHLLKTKCSTLILSSNPGDAFFKILKKHFHQVSANNVQSQSLPNLKHVIFTSPVTQDGTFGFQWKEDSPEEDCKVNIDDIVINKDDESNLFLTSGTSGFSKMAVVTHQYHNLILQNSGIDETSEFSILNIHNIYWPGGMPYRYLLVGCTTIMYDQRFPSDQNLHSFLTNVIIVEKCQVLLLSLAHIFQIFDCFKKLQSPEWPVKSIILSGQPMTSNILPLIGAFAETLYNIYGSSEMGGVSTKEIRSANDFQDYNTGTILSGVDVKIVDENMKPLPRGENGQILVKSKKRFKEYFGEEDLTKRSFTKDGYFFTNDYGCISENGELFCYGRMGDVINRGRACYHSVWIENVVKECPGVADVMVIKVPDDLLYNEICACVIPEEGSTISMSNIKDFCHAKFVSYNTQVKTACPRYFVILQKFPLNSNGKYDKKTLEKDITEYINLANECKIVSFCQ